MKRKKIILLVVIIAILGGIAVASYGLYEYYRPERDIQASKADFELSVKDLVKEYLADEAKANQKYLSADGNSKIIVLEGKIKSIEETENKEKVVALRATGDEVGFRCIFLKESSENAKGLKEGQAVKIKGSITGIPKYDEDFEEYTDGTLSNCDLVK